MAMIQVKKTLEAHEFIVGKGPSKIVLSNGNLFAISISRQFDQFFTYLYHLLNKGAREDVTC